MNRSLKSKLTNAARRLVQRYPDDEDAQAVASELVPAPPAPGMPYEALIAATVATFWPSHSDKRAAELLRGALRRYRTMKWPKHRWLEKPPADPLESALWLLLSASDNIPSVRTITRKLDKSRKVGQGGVKEPAA